MADPICRDGPSRRQSFRRSLSEAGLPQDALERLEQKRKQLDESIHKYIAAKEREYKSFEKDLIQRHKLGLDKDPPARRRSSQESNQDTTSLVESPRSSTKHQSAVDALLSVGLRKDQIGQPLSIALVDDDGSSPTIEARPSLAGLIDRRASMERDKEFIGVFTPAFLPALAHKGSMNGTPSLGRGGDGTAVRAGSAPPSTKASGGDSPSASGVDMNATPKGNSDSDSVPQAKQKRPVHLQLTQRTSSSGSSADGSSKLPSALKSPSQRPVRKRVSLAVGDTIVAPSDNVPVDSHSNNSTPSHSRTRSPAARSEMLASIPPASTIPDPKDSPQQAGSITPPFSPLTRATRTSQSQEAANRKGKHMAKAEIRSHPAPAPTPPMSSPPNEIDGDLHFTLEPEEADDNPTTLRLDEDDEGTILGRVTSGSTDANAPARDHPASPPPTSPPATTDLSSSPDPALNFHPSSSVQPSRNPGFRRPSASIDPVYGGKDYARAEETAAKNEIYGSSYIRPPTKGSFSAGSLGESFMAQNAEGLRRGKGREARA